jgi:hypothetical protein
VTSVVPIHLYAGSGTYIPNTYSGCPCACYWRNIGVVSFKPQPFSPTWKEPLAPTENATWWVLEPVLSLWNWTTPWSYSLQPASNRDIQFNFMNRLLHTERQKEPRRTTEETFCCDTGTGQQAAQLRWWYWRWLDDLLHFCDHSLIFRNWINEWTNSICLTCFY